jgi:hypothetical protein
VDGMDSNSEAFRRVLSTSSDSVKRWRLGGATNGIVFFQRSNQTDYITPSQSLSFSNPFLMSNPSSPLLHPVNNGNTSEINDNSDIENRFMHLRTKPLSSRQERRLVSYLDDQFLQLTRGFKKR